MTIFREQITIRKDSDPETLIERFKERLKGYEGDQAELVYKVESAIREFAVRGKQLAGFDSVMKAKRNIEGAGHHVIVEIDYGRKPGLFARLFGAKG